MARNGRFMFVKYIGLTIVSATLLIAGAQLGWAAGENTPITLVYARGTDATGLDPAAMADSGTAIINMAIYDGLVKYAEDLSIAPALATSWTISDDELTMTFYLRKGVSFHDGTPVNADAVVFTINRLIDPNVRVPLWNYINFVESAEANDEYTVSLTLKYPHAPALARLTAPNNGIVSPAAVEKYGADFGNHPVGAGPFKLIEWARDDHILLAKNEDYWGDGPYVDYLMVRVIPEDGSRVLALEAGEVDITVRIPPMDVPRLKGEGLDVLVVASTRAIYIGMNNQYQMLKDPRVRQALNYAVNKEAILEVLLQDYGQVMDSPLTSEYFAHKTVGPYEYNPAKAKQLLAEAGYANGFEITMMTPHGRYLMDYRITEAVQGFLGKVGITVNIKEMEWATYLSTVRKPLDENPTQLFLLGWGPWILDPDQMLYPLFHSSQQPPNGSTYSFYKNARVDELLQIGTSTSDLEKRREVYEEAQEIIWNDAPWLFLHNEQQLVATISKVTGVNVLPFELLDFSNAKKAD